MNQNRPIIKSVVNRPDKYLLEETHPLFRTERIESKNVAVRIRCRL